MILISVASCFSHGNKQVSVINLLHNKLPPKLSDFKHKPLYSTSWFYGLGIPAELDWVVLLFHMTSARVTSWYSGVASLIFLVPCQEQLEDWSQWDTFLSLCHRKPSPHGLSIEYWGLLHGVSVHHKTKVKAVHLPTSYAQNWHSFIPPYSISQNRD